MSAFSIVTKRDCVVLCVRSLEMADDEDQSAAVTAGCLGSAADDMTSDCHSQPMNSCSAGARDTLTADSSDVLAVPT